MPPPPSLPAKHRLGITNDEWESLIRGLEENPDAKRTRSRKKQRQAVDIASGTRVEVLVAKQWRVGTALGAKAGADAAINNIYYDDVADSAQAGVVTFSSTNDEWRYIEEEML